MGLTTGTGPLGRQAQGVANFSVEGPAHALWWEAYPRRLRARLGGRTVVDSARGYLLHETGLAPVAYLPLEDFDHDLLVASSTVTSCPFKGIASYFAVQAGDARAPDAVWQYPDPIAGCPPIGGFAAIVFAAMDAWLEEEEEVVGKLRDPYHRVDVRRSARHVRVSVDGVVLAESRRPRIVFETGLAPRCYLPAADVNTGRLSASRTTGICPYKGVATYRHVEAGADGRIEDAVWSYDDPLPEASGLTGHLAFAGEGIVTTVDGRAW